MKLIYAISIFASSIVIGFAIYLSSNNGKFEFNTYNNGKNEIPIIINTRTGDVIKVQFNELGFFKNKTSKAQELGLIKDFTK